MTWSSLIFVNDSSIDGPLDELHRIRDSDSLVKIITFTRNFGQMAAMLAGFDEANREAVINISAGRQLGQRHSGSDQGYLNNLFIFNIMRQIRRLNSKTTTHLAQSD